MSDLARRLLDAILADDAAATAAALKAGANPDSIADVWQDPPLYVACEGGHLACAKALLAAGADPNALGLCDYTALHIAGIDNHAELAAWLLNAGADPTADDGSGDTPLHWAASQGHVALVRLLLEAAPQTALMKNELGFTPLGAAMLLERMPAARCLLERDPLSPAGELLAQLQKARRSWHSTKVLLLYAPLVARQPLSPAEWEQVPTPCPGLGAALPVVLDQSAEKAGMLVRHMPPGDRERLRTAALCLGRAQRRWRVALPAEIVGHLLALALAE